MTTQIQYKAWPDHEVPEDCSDFLVSSRSICAHVVHRQIDLSPRNKVLTRSCLFLCLLCQKLVNRVKKHRASKPHEPIVVHCSAGQYLIIEFDFELPFHTELTDESFS